MSVDTVNQALTAVRLRIAYNTSNAFSPEGKERLLYMAGCMRYYLMREDIQAFNDFVDNALASSPDTTDYLLEDLFEELNITVREELTAKLLEA
jgi:hypothetical protein